MENDEGGENENTDLNDAFKLNGDDVPIKVKLKVVVKNSGRLCPLIFF